MKKEVSKVYEKYLLKNDINDLIEQSKNALEPLDRSEKIKRHKEVKNCNHEFIFYDYDIVECVHCGLTNKYTILENVLNKYAGDKKYLSYETKLYNEYIKNNSLNNYLSLHKLKSDHLRVLYELAVELAYDKEDNNEIFDIMKELHDLENYTERKYICSLEDTIWLLQRYKEKKLFKLSKSINKLIKKIDF